MIDIQDVRGCLLNNWGPGILLGGGILVVNKTAAVPDTKELTSSWVRQIVLKQSQDLWECCNEVSICAWEYLEGSPGQTGGFREGFSEEVTYSARIRWRCEEPSVKVRALLSLRNWSSVWLKHTVLSGQETGEYSEKLRRKGKQKPGPYKLLGLNGG